MSYFMTRKRIFSPKGFITLITWKRVFIAMTFFMSRKLT